MMTPFSKPLSTLESLPWRLAALAATGGLAGLPSLAQASPSTNINDCLRPSRAVTATAGAAVLIPPGTAAPQLLAQALPSTAAPSRFDTASARLSQPGDRRRSQPLVAQAASPATLPACTYDPPLPPAPQVIRGLW